jgi:uncharacterized protein
MFYASPHSSLTAIFHSVQDWEVGATYTLDIPAFADAFTAAVRQTIKRVHTGDDLTVYYPRVVTLLTAHGLELAVTSRGGCSNTIVVTSQHSDITKRGIEKIVEVSLNSCDHTCATYMSGDVKRLYAAGRPEIVTVDLHAVAMCADSFRFGFAQHLRRVVRTADQAAAILAPGGVLILTVPTLSTKLLVDPQGPKPDPWQVQAKERDMLKHFHRHFNVISASTYITKDIYPGHETLTCFDHLKLFTVYLLRLKPGNALTHE